MTVYLIPCDQETGTCDRCEGIGPIEDLTRHSDGNLYCPDCDYQTEEDRMDAEADRMMHEEKEDK